MEAITVTTVPAARALSALLAATDWPEREQKPLPRGVHHEAAALKKHVGEFRDQAAARYLQTKLNSDSDLAPYLARA